MRCQKNGIQPEEPTTNFRILYALGGPLIHGAVPYLGVSKGHTYATPLTTISQKHNFHSAGYDDDL